MRPPVGAAWTCGPTLPLDGLLDRAVGCFVAGLRASRWRPVAAAPGSAATASPGPGVGAYGGVAMASAVPLVAGAGTARTVSAWCGVACLPFAPAGIGRRSAQKPRARKTLPSSPAEQPRIDII